jgi:hypothetical protein
MWVKLFKPTLVLGAALLGAVISGCGTYKNLVLQEVAPGSGHATGRMNIPTTGYQGTMEVDYEGQTYAGDWMMFSGESSSASFLAFGGFSGMDPVSMQGFGLGSTFSDTKKGYALLRSGSGFGMRCVFESSLKAQFAGFGKCQHQSGKEFDLQITTGDF